MSAELQYRHTATGATMRATVRQEQTTGAKVRMWNGSAWEDMTVANWATYLVTLTETPPSSYVYVGNMPAVAAGWYYVDVYSGTAINATVEATLFGYWDGTALRLGGADLQTWITGTPAPLTPTPGNPGEFLPQVSVNAIGGFLPSMEQIGLTDYAKLVTSGSAELLAATNGDATVAEQLQHLDADISEIQAGTGLTAEQTTAALLDEPLTDHRTAGTVGERLYRLRPEQVIERAVDSITNEVTIYRGDSYTGTDWQYEAPEGSTRWPADTSGWAARCSLRNDHTGDITTLTAAIVGDAVQIELPADTSEHLSANEAYTYDIEIYKDAQRRTLVLGPLVVIDDISRS